MTNDFGARTAASLNCNKIRFWLFFLVRKWFFHSIVKRKRHYICWKIMQPYDRIWAFRALLAREWVNLLQDLEICCTITDGKYALLLWLLRSEQSSLVYFYTARLKVKEKRLPIRTVYGLRIYDVFYQLVI